MLFVGAWPGTAKPGALGIGGRCIAPGACGIVGLAPFGACGIVGLALFGACGIVGLCGTPEGALFAVGLPVFLGALFTPGTGVVVFIELPCPFCRAFIIADISSIEMVESYADTEAGACTFAAVFGCTFVGVAAVGCGFMFGWG